MVLSMLLDTWMHAYTLVCSWRLQKTFICWCIRARMQWLPVSGEQHANKLTLSMSHQDRVSTSTSSCDILTDVRVVSSEMSGGKISENVFLSFWKVVNYLCRSAVSISKSTVAKWCCKI